MPNVSEMFPRKYLQGSDLNGSQVLTITGVELEEMRDPQKRNRLITKWVIRFQELEQGVILNSTRARELEQALGSDDTEDWMGQRVELFTREEECFGETWVVLHFRVARVEQRKKANGELSQAFEAFTQTILNEVKFYSSAEQIQEALKQCGYTTFKTANATKMRRALEKHAEEQALRAAAGELEPLPF